MEAAVVTPLLMILFVGIFEFSLMIKDSGSVSASTSAGARVGSADARDALPPSGCSSGCTPSTNFESVIQQSVTARLKDAGAVPEVLVIYRAWATNGMPCTSALHVTCSTGMASTSRALTETCTDCWIYSWNGTGWAKSGGSGWPAANQAACGDLARTDYLGVYVRAKHNMVTQLFGGSRTLTEWTMSRLEPVGTAGGSVACA
ncbi:MAG: pilus assembly protein [Acidimicrobiia bacterium]|nr:pilus assembly protein [Acidimicrobiia bacterium]